MIRHKRHWWMAFIMAIVIALPVQSAFAQPVGAASAAATQTNTIKVYVNDKQVSFTQQPVVKNGTTLVPMRPIFTALEAQVTWEEQTKTIFVRKGYTNIALLVDSSTAIVNGKQVKLGVPVQTVNGATMVPLRFVSEALGGKTEWDPKSSTIRIYSDYYLYQKQDEAARAAAEAAEKAKKKLSSTEIVALNDDKIVMIESDYGQGSGIVIGDRWILTNYHVISGASEGTVYFNDGSYDEIQGIVISDEIADLAIIQTEYEIGIEPVTIGSSWNVKKGDRVYAIGSPLGLQNTVSEGLISNMLYEQGVRYFQINAQIDHGSSGGGLFNEFGELIGITTSGIDASIADLNFAVSVAHAEWMLMELEYEQPADSEIGFQPSSLPASLTNASLSEIAELMEEEFGILQTTQGMAEFRNWSVTRDAQGWLVISNVIDPAFYMLYGHSVSDELRFWTVGLGAELQRMLPEENIQFLVYYSQTFDTAPRGFASGEVTPTGDGKYRLKYPIIDLQIMDRMHLQMR